MTTTETLYTTCYDSYITSFNLHLLSCHSNGIGYSMHTLL